MWKWNQVRRFKTILTDEYCIIPNLFINKRLMQIIDIEYLKQTGNEGRWSCEKFLGYRTFDYYLSCVEKYYD